MSKPEELLALQLKASKIAFEREYRPWAERRFRFDFYLSNNVLVEVQGGIWKKGAHSSGTGITRDCEKFCLAAIYEYRVMPVTPEQIKNGMALIWVQKALKGVGAITATDMRHIKHEIFRNQKIGAQK